MSPTISVLIPTFNRSAWLEPTLTSIFRQTMAPAEVIVVDDGSSDETSEVIKRLTTETTSWRGRLCYLQQPNQGKSVALNLALAEASGDWIAFDDSDDIWDPQKLEWQFRALGAFPDCGACFTDARFVNADSDMTAFRRAGKAYPANLGRIADPIRFVVNAPHGVFMQTILVRRDVMARVGEFDPRLRVGQDTDFVFRLALQTSLCYVNLPLVEIDRTAERSIGLTTQYSRRSARRLEAGELMFEKWLTMVDERDVTRSVRTLLGGFRNELANHHLLSGATSEARRAAARAFRADPSVRLALKLALLWLSPGWVGGHLRGRQGLES